MNPAHYVTRTVAKAAFLARLALTLYAAQRRNLSARLPTVPLAGFWAQERRNVGTLGLRRLYAPSDLQANRRAVQ